MPAKASQAVVATYISSRLPPWQCSRTCGADMVVCSVAEHWKHKVWSCVPGACIHSSNLCRTLQARENLRAWEHMWDPAVNPTFRPATNFGTSMRRSTRRRAKSMGAVLDRGVDNGSQPVRRPHFHRICWCR